MTESEAQELRTTRGFPDWDCRGQGDRDCPLEPKASDWGWLKHGDRDAAHKLLTSHLRLVIRIARAYRGYGLPISEAISEGNVGLMQAVERFEPEKGFRLATYAVWWINAAIREYM